MKRNFVSCNYEIDGFRDSDSVLKLQICYYDTQIFQAKQAVLLVVFQAKAVYDSFKSQ